MNVIPVMLIIFGIAMTVIGGYIVLTRDVFGKGELGKSLVQAIKLSGKTRARISMVIGFIIVLIGVYSLLNGALYPGKILWLIRQFD